MFIIGRIDTYCHTMFNSYKLQFLLNELSMVIPKNEQEEQSIADLKTAAKSAIRRHGYLWFVGD